MYLFSLTSFTIALECEYVGDLVSHAPRNDYFWQDMFWGIWIEMGEYISPYSSVGFTGNWSWGWI